MKGMLFYLANSLLGSPSEYNIPRQTLTGRSLGDILNVVYFVAGAVAVIVIIIAGINYTTATATGGNEKVAKARRTITYAVTGLAVIILAFGITNFITERF